MVKCVIVSKFKSISNMTQRLKPGVSPLPPAVGLTNLWPSPWQPVTVYGNLVTDDHAEV